MRLIKRGSKGGLSLTDDLPDQDIPEYVILSHTWGTAAQEVTLQDFRSRSTIRRTRKAGYRKIQFCSDQAARDGYRYFWIDSCCIDKTNLPELSEAITSMFRWYREAARCYVYLSDVNAMESQSDARQDAFRSSRWWTRSWTLQELLAPQNVDFFSSEGTRLGDKIELQYKIHNITGIPIDALRGSPLSDFSVSQRMEWAAKRNASRKEDEAYSLFGIFDVHMPLIYGEREKALDRLREQVEGLKRGDSNASATSTSAPHPVKKNYREVHVTILHWESDELQDMVQRISEVFRSVYRFEVRQIRLPHRHKVKLGWPYLDHSVIDERDLQIIYYLGSTMPMSDMGDGFLDIAASPARQSSHLDLYPDDPDPLQGTDKSAPGNGERFPKHTWLSWMLGIPELSSDVFLVLDCFVEELVGPGPDNFRFVLDGDYSWARYLVLFAGYSRPLGMPGNLSGRLMSLLEELASSSRFYAREGLITSVVLRKKLEEKVETGDDLNLRWFGNDGRDHIHISPLPSRNAVHH